MALNQTIALKLCQTVQCSQGEQQNFLTLSIDQHHKKALQDKNNEMNKTIIPIKEYSNKFLRSNMFKQKGEPPHRKLNTQQRFNVILKKKNALTKNLPKENWYRFEEPSVESSNQNQALIKVSRLYNSRRENVKTEASANTIDNNMSQMQMLDSSLFNLIAPASNLLNSSTKSRFFDQPHQPIQEKKHKSVSNKSRQNKDKISQSRGLEMFSKIFVRNKDEIFQKIQTKIYSQKSTAPKFYQIQQNFQTHKITPIQKTRKARILVETFRPKRKELIKKYQTNQNTEENDQFFELNGWETTI